MNIGLLKIVFRNLSFYRRTCFGVFLAALISSAILIGSLAVGDSVNYSLRRMLDARLGDIQVAMLGGERFFRQELSGEIADDLDTDGTAILALRGMVADSSEHTLVNEVDLLGIDESFFELGRAGESIELDNGQIALNRPLASRLGVSINDEVVVRIPKPSIMPRDIPLTPDSELSMAFRLEVGQILDVEDFGWFGLQANQMAPLNAFLPREWLGEQLDRQGQANAILLGRGETGISSDAANVKMGQNWQLADAQLQLRELADEMLEIRSSRVFIDHVLGEAAVSAGAEPIGVLTYFVNSIRTGDRSTPYSTVAAMASSEAEYSVISPNMDDDEIVINQWLAEDLAADVGDEIELLYYAFDVDRQLREQSSRFVVQKVVPIEGSAADPGLMPDFPGLADVDNCRDWEPGIPIDLARIRDKDEQYWDDYRGTPKAFVTLAAGQSMWANPYGELTAVRYKPGQNEESLAEDIFERVSPTDIGLVFRDAWQDGIAAQQQAMGFGQLFVGFNMFLIAASLVLIGLVFVFSVESRTDQIGMLKAVGYTDRMVKKLLILEGGLLGLAGVVVGSVLGLFYTRLMVWWLSGVFGQAGQRMIIEFSANAGTVAAGAFAAFFIVIAVIWLSVRKKMKLPARQLLNGEMLWQFFTENKRGGKKGLFISGFCLTASVVLLITAGRGKTATEAAGVFFGVGSLLLIGGLGLFHSLLTRTAGMWKKPMESLWGFGIRNATRRSGRTLAIIAMLSAGIFVVIAVGANRQNPLAEAHRKGSGTGGFALFGRAAIGVPYNLATKSGRESVNLDVEELDDFTIAQLRVQEGDDASCFNLNRAQKPRLLGASPSDFDRRFSFIDVAEGLDIEMGWSVLEEDFGEGVVPAVGDAATIRWALGKAIGDEIEYTDLQGKSFRVRIVGMIYNSVLQGGLVVSDENFRDRFASEGYRIFLIDVDYEDVEGTRTLLSQNLRDFGLDLMPAKQRLAEFAGVENTYISMFQVLGGFGLVLGSFALGVVVLRNILDRRGELAMLQALGYKKNALKTMVFYEHIAIMTAGLVGGVVSALVAVSPQLASPGMDVPYLSMFLMVLAIFVSGFLWIWLAISFSLSGNFYDALRNE